jgi:hypothetical protein
MPTTTATALAALLETDSGVAPSYAHAPKQVTPGEAIELPGALLKWYAVYPPELPIPEEIAVLARAYLARTPLEARGLGFVILHRCGQGFYFLLVSTWRGSNELWETVLYKDGPGMADFALWPREGEHKPTYCVWEMVPIEHERRAWVGFLSSARDEAAAEGWLGEIYSGPA